MSESIGLGQEGEPVQKHVAEQTIARLSKYRRLLDGLLHEGTVYVLSRQLAEETGVTAAQVRRDMMVLGSAGSSRHGYEVPDLIRAIDDYLDAPEGQRVAVIGIGNLGRALMAFFMGRRPKLTLAAGFDNNPAKISRVINGCRIYPMDVLPQVVAEQGISIAIITVPESDAQAVADKCVNAGVRGILNFAPVSLRVPRNVYVCPVDLAMSLEKVAFFAKRIEEGRKPDDEA